MNKSEVIRFRCTKNLKMQIEKAASRQNRSVSNYIQTVIENELRKEKDMNSKLYVGKKWGDLTEELRGKLLQNANCVDGETGNNVDDGECIVDLNETISVAGKIEDMEIVIDDEAVIYNPEEGI